ncbi:MAG TPA: class I SAM-dependent methyltransferase [Candidatus Dormibacteraeota bacterium]|nr:class I SAM-dependent methyltransferase [Candidatus Dormibacteraeota bacterium]
MIDVTAFRAFEQAGWNERAGAYERFFTAVSEHNVVPLLDAAHVSAGCTVLDAGCGPGNLAAAAASRGALAVGTDLSDAMVMLAGKRYPTIEFRQADAEQLPFPEMSFDAVVSNLLVPHLPRPEAGIAELSRVLKPGGRLAVSMWDMPARSRLVGVMWEAIAEVGAPTPSDIPRGPATFRYSDEGELGGLLRSAGLDDINLRRIEFIHEVASLDELWEAWTEGSVRTASAVRDQPMSTQRQIRAAFDRLAGAYAGDEGLNVPVSFLIASGRKR